MADLDPEWVRLTAPELRMLAGRDAVVVLPVASVEQHGPHLATGTDKLLGEAVVRRGVLALRERGVAAVAAPCMWTGLAEHHMSFGGTFTLDPALFQAVLRTLVVNLSRHGFRRIALVNAHGGNIEAVGLATAALSAELGLPLVSCTYWIAAAEAFAAILTGQPNVLHACEAETSMVMALDPAMVRPDLLADAVPSVVAPVLPAGVARRRPFAAFTDTGVLGRPDLADPAKGERLLDAAGARIAEVLADPAIWT